MRKTNQRSVRQYPLRGKVILLGLTGSIAIYKSCELVRRLKEEGADVYCIMSNGAQEFISPLTFRALSGNPVLTQIWDQTLWNAAHLELAGKAHLYVIAPASANCLAQLSVGMVNDMISIIACATKAPLLIAPAMHENMWLHPATQLNVKRLKSYRYFFLGPEYGDLSQGQTGRGRMAEPHEILSTVKKMLRVKP